MGDRTQYTPGTFCWTDLATTDQPAAKAFYGELFGWQAEDMPVGDGVSYSMMRLHGKDVAAISPQPAQQREAGVPPTWNSYVSVESADDAAQRADELGASLVNEPGALVWNELSSPDLDASSAFYSGLFGWEVAPFEGSPEPYLAIKNGDASNGGIRELTPPGAPPHWLVYLGTEDIDASLTKVEQLGGTKLAGPIDIQIAKIAIVQDPQGATFALYAGQLEP